MPYAAFTSDMENAAVTSAVAIRSITHRSLRVRARDGRGGPRRARPGAGRAARPGSGGCLLRSFAKVAREYQICAPAPGPRRSEGQMGIGRGSACFIQQEHMLAGWSAPPHGPSGIPTSTSLGGRSSRIFGRDGPHFGMGCLDAPQRCIGAAWNPGSPGGLASCPPAFPPSAPRAPERRQSATLGDGAARRLL